MKVIIDTCFNSEPEILFIDKLKREPYVIVKTWFQGWILILIFNFNIIPSELD
jgi:hypothetical protein